MLSLSFFDDPGSSFRPLGVNILVNLGDHSVELIFGFVGRRVEEVVEYFEPEIDDVSLLDEDSDIFPIHFDERDEAMVLILENKYGHPFEEHSEDVANASFDVVRSEEVLFVAVFVLKVGLGYRNLLDFQVFVD
jgi:hypothetical protein